MSPCDCTTGGVLNVVGTTGIEADLFAVQQVNEHDAQHCVEIGDGVERKLWKVGQTVVLPCDVDGGDRVRRVWIVRGRSIEGEIEERYDNSGKPFCDTAVRAISHSNADEGYVGHIFARSHSLLQLGLLDHRDHGALRVTEHHAGLSRLAALVLRPWRLPGRLPRRRPTG